MRALILGAACAALSACGGGVDTSPNVIIETNMGVIEIETYPKKAPASAGDFLDYIDRGLFNGEGFYRVVRADNDPLEMGMSLIQGGMLSQDSSTPPLAHEPTSMTGLRNDRGMVAIARDAPGTGSAAYFFINIGNNNFLDEGGERNPDKQGYAVFGKVVQGMDVVKAIQAGESSSPVKDEVVKGQFLNQPVLITKAYRK